MRRATNKIGCYPQPTNNFYPRSPCGERHTHPITILVCVIISIHALLAESDPEKALQCVETPVFLSTLSLRRATAETAKTSIGDIQFLSTLSLRRATQKRMHQLSPKAISIHALLAESDSQCRTLARGTYGFLSTLSLRRATYYMQWDITDTVISIHALLAESDRLMKERTINWHQFLSTLSLRRATPRDCPVSSPRPYFYPRSPCGERHNLTQGVFNLFTFLSTLSLRRATHYDNYNLYCTEISIHALLAESDHNPRSRKQPHPNFYPRSPCGERRQNPGKHYVAFRFLSTLSLRRAT